MGACQLFAQFYHATSDSYRAIKKLLHSGTESVACSPRSQLQPVASILRAPAQGRHMRRRCLSNISLSSRLLPSLMLLACHCLHLLGKRLALPKPPPWPGATALGHHYTVASFFMTGFDHHGIQPPFPIFCSMHLMASGSHPCGH